ncbi:MAG: hypothetical protein QJR03_10510 [Sphaerobacter sp.]|nr:hypothetical protein [Sphaerobacter sp.]
MRGEPQVEQLDRYIDALQRGEEPPVDTIADPDLASLCALAREVRRLGAAGWPEPGFEARAVDWLASELSRPTAADDDDRGDAVPPPAADAETWAPVIPLERRGWARQGLELVAAVLVVALVATVVAAILRQRASVGDEPAPGAQPVITGTQPTPTATPTPTVAPLTHDPRLSALEAAAGFQLLAPTWLPDGFELEQTLPPMRLPGFTSVQFTYRDAAGVRALTVTQASPYEETRETMPAEIYDAAVEVDLGDGVTARVYEGSERSEVWWQWGPTTVRLVSGPVEVGGRVLTGEELVAIARSMAPVADADAPTSPPPGAALPTGDAAVARAREWVSAINGNPEATVSEVRLTTVAEPVALGMPAPAGMDLSAPAWQIEFADALIPPECPEAGSSVCSHGGLVVVLDAGTGAVLGWHGEDGQWQPPGDGGTDDAVTQPTNP